MLRMKILLVFILFFSGFICSAQVRVRVFSDKTLGSVVFSVTEGKYEITTFNGEPQIVSEGELFLISGFYGKLAVKIRGSKGLVCDSVLINGISGDDSFSLRANGETPVRQYYSGDLKCFSDLATIVLINTIDIEKYVSGVVQAEGGAGKNIEYFKSQAVIARTYMYKYFDKHKADRYNVCDNTHCQAFNGLSSNAIVNNAVLETQGLVILDSGSTLISSAFHSNCGGETSSSEDVWLTSQTYLKSVIDPYCLSSRNATWEKRIGMNTWLELIEKSGYTGKTDDPGSFGYLQKTRLLDYKSGSFSMPFRTIRTELNLRSTFFSVFADDDSIVLKGRGYGHGVGLCQEGAMAMAAKGFNCQQIIDFYYAGVIISDIKNAVFSPLQVLVGSNK